jgi:hypothetical protein
MISARTEAALATAKARSVKLGGDGGKGTAFTSQKDAGRKAIQVRVGARTADRHLSWPNCARKALRVLAGLLGPLLRGHSNSTRQREVDRGAGESRSGPPSLTGRQNDRRACNGSDGRRRQAPAGG